MPKNTNPSLPPEEKIKPASDVGSRKCDEKK
jgi:hypothetical protein